MGDDVATLSTVARPAGAAPAMQTPVGRASVLERHPRHAVAASFLGDHARRLDAIADAFITARRIAITSRVSGNIITLPGTDNQHVSAGHVIVCICAA